jgi:hypothetical protein
MRRIPIALIIAAVVAIGITVMITITVIRLQPSGGILILFKPGVTGISYVYQVLVGTTTVSHLLPVGYGKFTLNANTTSWYYHVETGMPYIIAVSKPFSGVATVNIGGTNYYICNSSNYGAVIRATDRLGWVGDWVYSGSFYVLNVRNVTDSTNYQTCPKNIITTAGWTNALLYEPRGDYFTYDLSTKTIKAFYDTIDSAGTITAKAGSVTITPKWTALSANTNVLVGYYGFDSSNTIMYYPTFIFAYYNGTVSTLLKITPSN